MNDAHLRPVWYLFCTPFARLDVILTPMSGSCLREANQTTGCPVPTSVHIREQKGAARVSQVKAQVVRASCPDCGARIRLPGTIQIGRPITCPNCDAELEVIETDPVELDWVYDDEYEDEDDTDQDED